MFKTPIKNTDMKSFKLPSALTVLFICSTMLASLTTVSYAQESSELTAQIYHASLDEVRPVETKSGYFGPRFPAAAGYDDVMKYVASKIEYPQNAIASGQGGAMLIRLAVDTTGKITACRFIQSPGHEFEEAVLKVISGMPRWVPARLDGAAVESKYDLKLNFRLQ
jgi:TonB family protein